MSDSINEPAPPHPFTYLDPQGRQRCTECGVTYDLCLCTDFNRQIHQRLWSPEGRTIRAVQTELLQAREKFPHPDHLLPALMGSVGGLSKAFLEHDRSVEGVTGHEILREAVRVATLALRLAVEGDPTFRYDPDEVFKNG